MQQQLECHVFTLLTAILMLHAIATRISHIYHADRHTNAARDSNRVSFILYNADRHEHWRMTVAREPKTSSNAQKGSGPITGLQKVNTNLALTVGRINDSFLLLTSRFLLQIFEDLTSNDYN